MIGTKSAHGKYEEQTLRYDLEASPESDGEQR